MSKLDYSFRKYVYVMFLKLWLLWSSERMIGVCLIRDMYLWYTKIQISPQSAALTFTSMESEILSSPGKL